MITGPDTGTGSARLAGSGYTGGSGGGAIGRHRVSRRSSPLLTIAGQPRHILEAYLERALGRLRGNLHRAAVSPDELSAVVGNTQHVHTPIFLYALSDVVKYRHQLGVSELSPENLPMRSQREERV